MAKTTNGKTRREIFGKARLMSRKSRQKKMLRDCHYKLRFFTSHDAWEAAKHYFVVHEKTYEVYSCNKDKTGKHYHLATSGGLGDFSQFPDDVRELYFTLLQPKAKPCFWMRLRAFLIGHEKEKDTRKI